jgi:hypothetical protein
VLAVRYRSGIECRLLASPAALRRFGAAAAHDPSEGP